MNDQCNAGSPSALSRLMRTAIRLPLRVIPKSTVIRVLRGPLSGMRWIVGGAPNGAWLGTLEASMMAQFAKTTKEGMTVWDVGANVGLYSLAAARCVGAGGNVFAFEPMPRNLEFLHRHVELNGLSNTIVVPVAVGNHDGTARMSHGDSPSEFHLDAAGDLEVAAIRLNQWRKETGSPPPDVVKIDVEGAETLVLQGAAETFRVHRPVIFLSLHGERQRDQCGALLRAWGYVIESATPGVTVERSSEWLARPAMGDPPSSVAPDDRQRP